MSSNDDVVREATPEVDLGVAKHRIDLGAPGFTAYNPERAWQNEPDRELFSLNPFAWARNSSGWKQTDIANELNIAPVIIARLEQGVIHNPVAPLVEWYLANVGMSPNWETEYRDFQRKIRESAARPIHGEAWFPAGPITFRRWRAYNWPNVSQSGWAKMFCINPGIIAQIEKLPKFNGVVPSFIIDALKQAKIFDEAQARRFIHTIKQAKGGSNV